MVTPVIGYRVMKGTAPLKYRRETSRDSSNIGFRVNVRSVTCIAVVQIYEASEETQKALCISRGDLRWGADRKTYKNSGA